MQPSNQYPPPPPPPQYQYQQQGQYPPMGAPQYPQQNYPMMQQPQYPPPPPPPQYQMPPPQYGQVYSAVPPPPPPPINTFGGQMNMPPLIINQAPPISKGQVDFLLPTSGNSLPSSANGVPYPASVRCPCCKTDVTTVLEEEAGTGAYCCCLLLLCLPPFCCVPFCISNCKDKKHRCPKCETPVGLYEYKVC